MATRPASLLYLSSALLAVGCTTQPIQPMEYISPIEGVWVGRLESAFVNADGSATTAVDDLLVAVCGSKAVVWNRPEGGNVQRNTEALPVASLLNMHKISVFHEDAAKPARWAEQQTYTLIAHKHGQAELQWSRAVTNPLAAHDQPRRYFVGYGIAEMHRQQDTCDPSLGR